MNISIKIAGMHCKCISYICAVSVPAPGTHTKSTSESILYVYLDCLEFTYWPLSLYEIMKYVLLY